MSWPRAKRPPRVAPDPPWELLPRLGPEVLRVYAACVAFEEAHGDRPSAEVVVELAKEEGASVGACLVMVRWELFDREGNPCPLEGVRVFYGPVVVEDAETCIALEIRSGLGISLRLEKPGGTRVNKHDLIAFTDLW